MGGTIYVHIKSLRHFTSAEIKFILAHESCHILKNHLVSKIAWNIIEQLVKGLVRSQNVAIVELVKAALALMSRDHLPPNARSLRDNEYEADCVAVKMTGDIQ